MKRKLCDIKITRIRMDLELEAMSNMLTCSPALARKVKLFSQRVRKRLKIPVVGPFKASVRVIKG
jgi:hypothetical protein